MPTTDIGAARSPFDAVSAGAESARWRGESGDSGAAIALAKLLTDQFRVKLLSMILTDAADEGLMPAKPVHRRRRRGRRSHRERVWATPDEVLRIVDQAQALGGDTAKLLIITAAGPAVDGASSPDCTATISTSAAAS